MTGPRLFSVVHLTRAKQFFKYCTTGVANTGISYAVYALVLGLSRSAPASLAVGYTSGMVSSYLINSTWTFKTSTARWGQVARFLLGNLLMLGFAEVSLWFILNHVTGSKYLAQAINIVPVTLLGFAVNRMFVFRSET